MSSSGCLLCFPNRATYEESEGFLLSRSLTYAACSTKEGNLQVSICVQIQFRARSVGKEGLKSQPSLTPIFGFFFSSRAKYVLATVVVF